MSEVRPVRNRELLLDDETRALLKDQVDPLITRALSTRGYSEIQLPSKRIALSGALVAPSDEYRSVFQNTSFDALHTRALFAVEPGKTEATPIRHLAKAELTLNTIGGIATGRVHGSSGRYRIEAAGTSFDPNPTIFENLDEEIVGRIMQDIRAHTPLGYSQADTDVPPMEVLEELNALHEGHTVDRRAQFEVMSDDPYGKILFNIGESFEAKRHSVQGKQKIRTSNATRAFELISKIPLEDGFVTLGARYTSGSNSEAKLTAELEGVSFDNERTQRLYDQIVYDYQHKDPSKFGAGVTRNLVKIIENSGDIIRIG